MIIEHCWDQIGLYLPIGKYAVDLVGPIVMLMPNALCLFSAVVLCNDTLLAHAEIIPNHSEMQST
jgi:hypothetical protein